MQNSWPNEVMISISSKLFQTIKLNQTPAYKLAFQAGIHPNTLSKILHSALPIKNGDSRVLRLGEVLGLKPEELFEAREESK